MMKRKIFFAVFMPTILLLLSACGGGGGGTTPQQVNPGASNWGEMVWDQDNWG